MRRSDITHGGLCGDSEKPHQLERIAGGKRLVEHAVLAQADERDVLGQGFAKQGSTDCWLVQIEGRLLADEEVRVG
ncbi:hypothetical protein ACIQZB_37910 [Streptomyces sp. NPDC097727]|uniref:hypothetical protein n=1 Tax=Streptomyces sp. NPDC097727 TaxID=3366092 RepID=UPI0038206AE4